LPTVELRSAGSTIPFLFRVEGIADSIRTTIGALIDRAFSTGGLASGAGITVVVKEYKVATIAKLVRGGPVVEEKVEVGVDIVLELSLLVVNTRDIALVIAIAV
jgi:hypothetical protein